MKDNNKLIAEFMGYINNGDDEFLIHPVTNHDVNDFPYDTSWDWLMPVVQKIYQLELDNEGALLVRDAVAEANRNNTHQAVVEFIKIYNDGDARTS
jgi:hypothetical protein